MQDPLVRLDQYGNSNFDRGGPAWKEGLWMLVSALFVDCWLPGSKYRASLLKLFGARIGSNVVVKPNVRVKFPWKLTVGDNSWIGEGVWIDNLASVKVGQNVCISQGAYLCCGNHNYKSPNFDLIVQPIEIADGAWVGASSTISPGTFIQEGAVLTLGSSGRGELSAWKIYQGNPAREIAQRKISYKEHNAADGDRLVQSE